MKFWTSHADASDFAADAVFFSHELPSLSETCSGMPSSSPEDVLFIIPMTRATEAAVSAVFGTCESTSRTLVGLEQQA